MLLLVGVVSFAVGFGGHPQAAQQSQQDAATIGLTTTPLSTESTAPPVTITTGPTTTVPTTTTTTAAKTAPKYQGVSSIPAPTQHPVTNVPLPPPPHQNPVAGCTPTHSGNPAGNGDVRPP